MIRFAAPLAFAALPALAVLIVLSRARLRELALPALAAFALIIALSGPEWRDADRRESAWILLDRSPSVVAATADREVEAAVASLRAANPTWRFGVVAFASRAAVMSPVSDAAIPWASLPGQGELGTRTDLASAVRLALDAVPEGGVGQIVLASDGRVTDGLAGAVLASVSAKVPISTLPLGRAAPEDVALASLEVPARLVVGRPFRVTIDVEAVSAGVAVLALYRNGELISSQPVSLEDKDRSSFQIVDTLTQAGSATYLAVVRRQGDPIAENDCLSAFAEAGDPAPLLLVSDETSADALMALLAASNRAFDVSSSVPPLEELAKYRTVIVTGFPFDRLQAEEIETLHSFVADLGGGLLVAEGETELRGVRGDGMEDLLPVSYTIPQHAEQASLAVIYVLDRSGSMKGSSGSMLDDPAKISTLRDVTAASIDLLEPDARVGIIAFDWDVEWIHRVAPVGDGRSIHEGLGTLRASGGTDLYPPIIEALDAIKAVQARVKHILVISDGRAVDEPRDWESLYARLEAETGIHLSVIAVGYEPNRQLLGRLAAAGHGSAYIASDFAALPQISMEVTKSLLRSRFVDEETQVSGPLARGELAAIPPVQGYALTYPRPTAEVLLFSAADPLFARWRLGLGRVGVLNTDLAGAWSGSWLSWSRAPLFLETLLDAVEAETWIPHGLRLFATVGRAGIQVRVEAREVDGTLANFLDLEAALVPDGAAVPLLQTNVGSYEGILPVAAEGSYALRVADRTGERIARVPISVAYSEEYRRTGADAATLRAVAAETGGRFLEDGTALGLSGASGRLSYRPIHDGLLLLSIVLFLLELGRRKLPSLVKRPTRRAD